MFWANTATGLCKHEPWMGGTYVLILAVQNVQAMSSPPATRVQNEHSFHKTNHTLLHAWLLNWYKNRERYRELQDKSNIWICFLWRWKPVMLPFAWQQDEPAEIRDSFLRRMMLRIVKSWSTWEVSSLPVMLGIMTCDFTWLLDAMCSVEDTRVDFSA